MHLLVDCRNGYARGLVSTKTLQVNDTEYNLTHFWTVSQELGLLGQINVCFRGEFFAIWQKFFSNK
jgi:hypothetical protein